MLYKDNILDFFQLSTLNTSQETPNGGIYIENLLFFATTFGFQDEAFGFQDEAFGFQDKAFGCQDKGQW